MFQKFLSKNNPAGKLFNESPAISRAIILIVVVLIQVPILVSFRQQQSKVYVSQAASLLNAQVPPSQAKPFGEKAVQMNKQDGYAWFYYGTASYLDDDMAESIPILENAIQVLPHSYNAVRLLAFAHYKDGRFEESASNLADYLLMVPRPPVSPEMVYRMAGLAFLRLGELADSNYYLVKATDFSEQPELKGDLQRVRTTVALLCNQSWTAEYNFRTFRTYQPDTEFNPFELIANASKTNKIPTTIGFFQAAHFRDRSDLSVIKALAASYMAGGQSENAITLLRNTVDRYPEDASMRLALGDVLFANKQYPQAFEHYDEHLTLDQDSPFRQDILRKKATTRY